MADANTPQEESTETSGGWWGSWLSSAKSKSAEVYSMVKKDLDEISNAVKSEASQVYSATSSAIEKTLKLDEPESTANTMKKSFSTFLDQVNTVLNPQPDDTDTEVILSTGDTTMLTTYKKELEALQRLDATFLVPADSAEFAAWKSSMDESELAVTASSVERRLRNEPILVEQREKLVPAALEEQVFWERYQFRVALLQDRLAAALRRGGGPATAPETSDPVLAHLPLQMEQAERTEDTEPRSAEKTPASSTKSSPAKTPTESLSKSVSMTLEASASDDIDEGVAWEEEDFASDVELTEEQQTLLLQEYEREIATKKQQKVPTPKDQAINQNQSKSPSKVQKLTKQNQLPIDNTVASKRNSNEKPNHNATKSNPKFIKPNSQVIKTASKNDKNVLNKNSSKSISKQAKPDLCANVIEDHFNEDTKSKDDASSNSDESWEKEFEIEEAA